MYVIRGVVFPHIFYTPQANRSDNTNFSVYILANYFISFKIAEIWFVFRNFSSVTEVAKINSKAGLYFSIDRRLIVTEKN